MPRAPLKPKRAKARRAKLRPAGDSRTAGSLIRPRTSFRCKRRSKPPSLATLFALVWLPGQWTPIHDHGTWGVVGVVVADPWCDQQLRPMLPNETDDAISCGEIDLHGAIRQIKTLAKGESEQLGAALRLR